MKQERLTKSVHTLINSLLHKDKNLKTITGYSIGELKQHLEKNFKPNMNWDNYGKWHIDHIIPSSKFEYTEFENESFLRCWALNNIQPLWACENMRKGGANRQREYSIKEIKKLWNEGKTIIEICKTLHAGNLTIKSIIISQIGIEKYKRRIYFNMKKGMKKAKLKRTKNKQ